MHILFSLSQACCPLELINPTKPDGLIQGAHLALLSSLSSLRALSLWVDARHCHEAHREHSLCALLSSLPGLSSLTLSTETIYCEPIDKLSLPVMRALSKLELRGFDETTVLSGEQAEEHFRVRVRAEWSSRERRR